MSLRLLVDEDSQGKLLVALLRQAGHDVQTVSDAGLRAARDDTVWCYAISKGRIVLTQNCADFIELLPILSEQGTQHHPGLLLIYKDNDVRKDMSAATILRAIKNLERSKLRLDDRIVVLNHYNY